jgi:hypothetical protein
VLTGPVEARVSQVVYYDVDLSTMSLPAGHNHVCAAAFVTSVSAADRLLTPGNTSVDALTMVDRHVAHRNLHLVPAGAKPVPPPRGGWQHKPQTILLDFHNAHRKEVEIEIVVDRHDMVGQLTMMLPPLERADAAGALRGWRRTERPVLPGDVALPQGVAEQAGSFLARLGEAVEAVGEQIEQVARHLAGDLAVPDEREIPIRGLEGLDRSVVYVADATASSPTISGIRLPAGGHTTAAITVRAPEDAKPGDQFRFDVLQRRGAEVMGGSTYVLSVFEAR